MKNPYAIDYSTLPGHMQEGIQAYIETGRPTGDFLRAVLSNNLMSAFAHADDTNRHCMFDWACFLFNQAPIGCYGSEEKFLAWIKCGGLGGNEQSGGWIMSYDMQIGAESYNYTYNVSPMFYAAIPDKGIRAHYGMTGAEALPVLRGLREYMEDNREALELLNPENGWGDYYGALEFVNDLIRATLRNPDEIWSGD